jgi:urease accessory protein
MIRPVLHRTALAAAVALLPTMAFAHPGHGDAVGLAHGFMHPLTGVDHVLAMVLVGVFAAQLGGRALWMVPAAFVAVMAMGGVLGMSAVGVPFVELGIALSVVVLGAAVALRMRPPVTVAMAVVGLFAVFHGFAHGAEMPAGISGVAYGAAFLAATAMLHAAGVGLGVLLGRASGRVLVRMAGALAALAGVGLASGII